MGTTPLWIHKNNYLKKKSRKLKSTLRNFLCWIKVLCKTVNPHFKSDANQARVKTKKSTEKKTNDFDWKISRRMQYDNKILLLKT